MEIDSGKILYEILHEIREMNKTNIEILKYEKENKVVLNQMAEYLRDYQSIIDFQLENLDIRNQEMMRELKTQVTRMSVLVDPDVVGAYRSPNTVLISSESAPVNTSDKSILLKYAENTANTLTTIYDRAYYRIGYLVNLGTSYAELNEGVTEIMGATQTLDIVSSSASDKGTVPAGIGVQQLILWGLNASGLRFNETVILNGTTTVTTVNQFSQIDAANSLATGTNDGAVGTITISGNTDAVTYAKVSTTENQWRTGSFYTDGNAAGYVDQWDFASYTNTVRGQLKAGSIQGALHAMLIRSNCLVSNSSVVVIFPVPIRVPKQSLSCVRAISKNLNTETYTSYQMHFRVE